MASKNKELSRAGFKIAQPEESPVDSAPGEIIPKVSAEDLELEQALQKQVIDLWNTQQRSRKKARQTRDELRIMRMELGKSLYQLKALHVKSGRGGRWSSVLFRHGISRATADRYVAKHQQSIAPRPESRLDRPLPEPSPDEIRAHVIKLAPRLLAYLRTPAAVTGFLAELRSALEPLTQSMQSD
jgi:hypothetical protein